jgi:hypothetical protein
MDKIDRLGWAAGVAVQVFGVRIGIRVSDPLVREAVLSRVPAGWTRIQSAVVDRLYSIVTPLIHRRNVRHLCVLYGDHTRLSRTERIEDLLDYFESDLDLHIAANSQNQLFIHAGGVRWKGRTILIPGRSHTGKTTLVAEFLKSGAAYYSDDFAAVDHAGYLHAGPRDLSVRTESNISKRVRPEEFGAARAQPRPISFVLLTEYAEGARWSPHPLSRGQGMLGLLENTPSARKQPGFALRVLQRAVESAEIHQGYRGDKQQTVQEVMSYLDGRSVS